MAKERMDYYFENNKLKLVPLDLKQQFIREEWIRNNEDKNKWQELTIPDITFIEFVGNGANGIVLKAREDITDRLCAVKIWLPNVKSRHYNIYFEKYQEEIKKIAHLNNPSIIAIYKAGISKKGYCYSIMEWVEGVTLKKHLAANKSIAANIRFKILNDVLQTVNECHRINVLHGDLHSENILLKEMDNQKGNYEVKILDFGTSLLNRSTSEKYNKQRESALLLETVLKLLPEENKYGLLNFKYYSSLNPRRHSIRNLDDVRCVEPIIVSSTLKNIVKIYELVGANYFNDAVLNDMLDFLLASTYLDVQSISEFISLKGRKMEKKLLMTILTTKIYDYLFETKQHDLELRSFELTLSYYELLKKNVNLTILKNNDIFKDFNIIDFNFEEILELKSLEDVLKFIKLANKSLEENEYIRFLNQLFTTLGEKFEKEYSSHNGLKRDLDLVFKLNELRLKRNYLIEEIIKWEYR
ncbi:protein kinase domain-containing protein [Planococcus versutus]|uniref:Protein kinase domain-containing protein n=1 Tax=Planococcus versutus TaxID=1302659 RepID=A0A1B1RY17_9BACL|nr:protein kinase [Planococcus versutus]ANU25816.1 hypothetical protein I858_001835 [Planococcus versutus]